MKTVIILTPYINYESFMYLDDNPLDSIEVFAASTPEELRTAQTTVLRKLYADDFPLHLFSSGKPPTEPKFTLAEMKNTGEVERRTALYEEYLAAHKRNMAVDEEAEAFLAGVSDNISEALFSQLWKNAQRGYAEYFPVSM